MLLKRSSGNGEAPRDFTTHTSQRDFPAMSSVVFLAVDCHCRLLTAQTLLLTSWLKVLLCQNPPLLERHSDSRETGRPKRGLKNKNQQVGGDAKASEFGSRNFVDRDLYVDVSKQAQVGVVS